MTKQYNNKKIDINLSSNHRETLACLGLNTENGTAQDDSNLPLLSELSADKTHDNVSSVQIIDTLKQSIGTLHQLLSQLENFNDVQIVHQAQARDDVTQGTDKMSVNHQVAFKPDMTYQKTYQQESQKKQQESQKKQQESQKKQQES